MAARSQPAAVMEMPTGFAEAALLLILLS